MPANLFVGRIASECESRWPEIHSPRMVRPAVEFLVARARAGAGPVIGFGIGTSRLAVPRDLDLHSRRRPAAAGPNPVHPQSLAHPRAYP